MATTCSTASHLSSNVSHFDSGFQSFKQFLPSLPLVMDRITGFFPSGFNFRNLSPSGLGSNALDKIHLSLKVPLREMQSLLRKIFQNDQLIQLSFQTLLHTHFTLADVQSHLPHILRGFGGRGTERKRLFTGG